MQAILDLQTRIARLEAELKEAREQIVELLTRVDRLDRAGSAGEGYGIEF